MIFTLFLCSHAKNSTPNTTARLTGWPGWLILNSTKKERKRQLMLLYFPLFLLDRIKAGFSCLIHRYKPSMRSISYRRRYLPL